MVAKNIIFVSSTSTKLIKLFKEAIQKNYHITWYKYSHLASWILEQGLGYEMTTEENDLVVTLTKALDDYKDCSYKDLISVIEQFERGELGTDFLVVEFPCAAGYESTVDRYARMDKAGRRMGRDNIYSVKLTFAPDLASKARVKDNRTYDYDIYNTTNEVQMKMKAKRLFDRLLQDVLEERASKATDED